MKIRIDRVSRAVADIGSMEGGLAALSGLLFFEVSFQTYLADTGRADTPEQRDKFLINTSVFVLTNAIREMRWEIDSTLH